MGLFIFNRNVKVNLSCPDSAVRKLELLQWLCVKRQLPWTVSESMTLLTKNTKRERRYFNFFIKSHLRKHERFNM